jgi:hypothetical protein
MSTVFHDDDHLSDVRAIFSADLSKPEVKVDVSPTSDGGVLIEFRQPDEALVFNADIGFTLTADAANALARAIFRTVNLQDHLT